MAKDYKTFKCKKCDNVVHLHKDSDCARMEVCPTCYKEDNFPRCEELSPFEVE